MTRAPFVALLLPLVIGCGYTEMHEAVLRPPSPPTSNVEIYLVDQSPNRPFYEVALVEVFGYGSDSDLEDLSAALQARGRRLGCDALLRVHFETGRTMAHGYGVCVKWSPVAADTIQTTRPASSVRDAGAD